MSDQAQQILVPDRLWDGKSDEVSEGRAIVVENGRIVAVLPIGEIPDSVGRRKFPECTLLPGLIDAHAHYAESFGPLFLAAGITTIRDTGNEIDFILSQREANLEDPSRGPRIVCCGWALDGPIGIWKHIVKQHPDNESLRSSIRESVEKGVDQIKLYASNNDERIKVGVDTAHAAGKFVLAHLNDSSAEAAAVAGLNEIEHFSRCDVAWREAGEDEDDRLIDLFLENGVIMNPTLSVWDRIGRAMEHGFLRDEKRRWVHPQLLDIWERFPYRRCGSDDRMRFQKTMPHLKRFLLRSHERGVTTLAGTDTPFINLIPGFALHDELAQYVDAGLRPLDALRATTGTNARILGLEDEIGRIAPGMVADFVVVEGNPLVRIDDLANVRVTFRSGRAFEPHMLLEDAESYFGQAMKDPIIIDLIDYVAGEMPTYRQKGGD